MRRGTKIGWLLVAVSLILSVWVISSQSSNATTLDGGFEVSDVDPTVLQGYTGPGGAITIPSSITSINAAVFANNTSITSVTMPDTVTSMGSGVFQGCSNLSSVILCTNIASLSLPNSVTTIESNAFSGSGIGTITIPAATTSIATQSGWTPSSIYGYANSQAETYAMDNGIPFFVIGGSEDDDDNGNTDNGNGDNGNTDNGNTDNGNTDNGNTDNGNTDNGNTDNGNTDNGNTDNGNTGQWQWWSSRPWQWNRN